MIICKTASLSTCVIAVCYLDKWPGKVFNSVNFISLEKLNLKIFKFGLQTVIRAS